MSKTKLNSRQWPTDAPVFKKIHEIEWDEIEVERRKSGRDNAGVKWNEWRWAQIHAEKAKKLS